LAAAVHEGSSARTLVHDWLGAADDEELTAVESEVHDRVMPHVMKTPWPHAPRHELSSTGTYIVTAGTYLKKHYFRGREQLAFLQHQLLTVIRDFEWQLQAWALFSNHYHFVAHSPENSGGAESLTDMLRLLHEKTAKQVIKSGLYDGQQIWHNFWDTKLTYEKSFLARLKYVHTNPVRHGLVWTANQYPWCSAAWFERTARPAAVKMIYSFKTERVTVYDEYDVAEEW
jgi:putative transposase